MEKGELLETLREIYEMLDVPDHCRIAFNGVEDKEIGLAILCLKNPKKRTVIHARYHVKCPGLCVGFLGRALDDAVTEYLTLGELRKECSPFTRWSISASEGCKEGIDLLKRISKVDPGLLELLEERYKSNELNKAQELAVALIDGFGLEVYLDLYLASPLAKELKKGNLRQVVIVQTGDVSRRIRKKRSP